MITFGTLILSISDSLSPEELLQLCLEAREFAIFVLNLISVIYFFLKFYTALCYTKITFEWLPMINPYLWPFSFFQIITRPYYAFWAKVLPTIKFEKSSFDVSAMVGVIALNSMTYLMVRSANGLIQYLESLQKTIFALQVAFSCVSEIIPSESLF